MSKKSFKDLPREEQIAAVRLSMEAGGSNTSVARALGTTPGTVAGIRFKNNIPSRNQPHGQSRTTDTKSSVLSDTSEPSRTPFKLKMAASEAKQCLAFDEGGRQCAGAREAGSDYCAKPDHQALEKKLQKKPARR